MKPEWYEICESPELRERFRELAHSFTRNPELREDLYQEAWLAVCEYLSGIQPPSEGYKGGTAPGGEEFLARDKKSLSFYEKIGYRAMNRYQMREVRYRKMFKPWVGSASYHRVRRKFIRIKKKKKESAKNEGVSCVESSER